MVVGLVVLWVVGLVVVVGFYDDDLGLWFLFLLGLLVGLLFFLMFFDVGPPGYQCDDDDQSNSPNDIPYDLIPEGLTVILVALRVGSVTHSGTWTVAPVVAALFRAVPVIAAEGHGK